MAQSWRRVDGDDVTPSGIPSQHKGLALVSFKLEHPHKLYQNKNESMLCNFTSVGLVMQGFKQCHVGNTHKRYAYYYEDGTRFNCLQGCTYYQNNVLLPHVREISPRLEHTLTSEYNDASSIDTPSIFTGVGVPRSANYLVTVNKGGHSYQFSQDLSEDLFFFHRSYADPLMHRS